MTPTPPLTRAALLQRGTTDAEVRRQLRSGTLERLRRNAYATPLPAGTDNDTRHRRLVTATVPELGGGTVLSHASAAVIWGLSTFPCSLTRVTVTRATAGHGKRDRLVHARQAPLAADEVVERDGVRVTSLARTVVDLARSHPYEWGVAWCDQALRLGCPLEELADAVGRARRRPGNGRARSALAFADARAESPLESLSRVAIARLGLPAPVLQFEIRTPTGDLVARSDFGWPGHRLVGEADGRAKYEPGAPGNEVEGRAVMREKRREQAVRAEGWWLVRWGMLEALHPDRLGRLLRNGFELAPKLLRP